MNKYYLMVLLGAFLAALSQILLKISVKKSYSNRILEYLNPWVIVSYVILAVTLILTSYVLRYITIVNCQAINCASYFFVLIMEKLILKERISWNMIVGNVIVILGVMLVMT